MTDPLLSQALLPDGLHDVLPPDAGHEAALVERLMGIFVGQGYDRIKAPLIEFEDSLLAGAGAGLARQTFRLMDPVSQRMMAVRSDITPQAARIAVTRLAGAARPLRLSYAGQVLRVRGSQMRPERQFAQVGVELFGTLAPGADAEVVLLAAEALRAVGVRGVSVDLNVPTLVPAVLGALGVSGAEAARLRQALDRKDAAGVAAIGGPAAGLLGGLLAATGTAARALAGLQALDLPAAAGPDRQRLTEVVELVLAAAPDLTVTVDPVEFRGFEYQTGISFTLFARDVRGELGRGGRYRTGTDEPATGFTLYLDTVLRAVPPPPPSPRIYVPAGTARSVAAGLRADGYITVMGLDPVADSAAEARAQSCRWVLSHGRATLLD